MTPQQELEYIQRAVQGADGDHQFDWDWNFATIPQVGAVNGALQKVLGRKADRTVRLAVLAELCGYERLNSSKSLSAKGAAELIEWLYGDKVDWKTVRPEAAQTIWHVVAQLGLSLPGIDDAQEQPAGDQEEPADSEW